MRSMDDRDAHIEPEPSLAEALDRLAELDPAEAAEDAEALAAELTRYLAESD